MAHVSLVPTPIGNLADITLRALEVLKNVDVIAAEDTRHTQKLLTHYGIDKPLVRLDAHTIRERAENVLTQHQHIAYVTDAGTPGLSDPGSELITIALQRGDTVEVLPGATALIPALVLSTFPLAQFSFEGFLPRKGADRKKRLELIAKREATTGFYESPKRLLATLKALAEVCGEARQVSVSRELSKRFETTYRGSLAQVIQTLSQNDIKGECVVVVSPAESTPEDNDFTEVAKQLAAEGLSGRDLRKALTALGAPRNTAYDLSLELGD